MKKKGASTFIIIFVVLGLLLAGGFLWEYLDAKHEDDLIQAAQNADLGEGITLLQGVQAYFDDDGYWDVAWDDEVNDDTICLSAGDFFDGHSLHATFKVNQETEQLDILTFYYDGLAVGQDEIHDIIDAMIQAAKT